MFDERDSVALEIGRIRQRAAGRGGIREDEAAGDRAGDGAKTPPPSVAPSAVW